MSRKSKSSNSTSSSTLNKNIETNAFLPDANEYSTFFSELSKLVHELDSSQTEVKDEQSYAVTSVQDFNKLIELCQQVFTNDMAPPGYLMPEEDPERINSIAAIILTRLFSKKIHAHKDELQREISLSENNGSDKKKI